MSLKIIKIRKSHERFRSNENIEKANTHKNKIILFIIKIYLILFSYANKVF